MRFPRHPMSRLMILLALVFTGQALVYQVFSYSSGGKDLGFMPSIALADEEDEDEHEDEEDDEEDEDEHEDEEDDTPSQTTSSQTSSKKSATKTVEKEVIEYRPVTRTVIVTDPLYTTDTDGDQLVDGVDPEPTVDQRQYFTDDDQDGMPNILDQYPDEDDFAYLNDATDTNHNGLVDLYE